MTNQPFDLLFLCTVAALLLALVVCTAVVLALAALLPRGSPTADWLRNLAAKLPRFASLGIEMLYGLIFVGAIALAVIATLVYA